MAGIGESLLLVSFCGLCTFLTGISLSAIATNGAMKVDNVCNLLFFFFFRSMFAIYLLLCQICLPLFASGVMIMYVNESKNH